MDPLEEVSRWPVTTAAVTVISPAGILASHGPTAVLPWASVTKLLTALTVLDAVHEGVVALDEPAGPPGSTVRHLLAHASGLSPEDDRVLAKPARYRIYSNRGFELLGQLLTERTGTPFEERLRSRVLEPVGLRSTRITGSPASGASGSITDLASLAQELMRPTLLPTDLMAEATRTAFAGLSGVLPGFGRQSHNDWGLGFELRDEKNPHWTGSRNSPRTFGHFGRAGGFLWVDPDLELACACLTDREFGDWAIEAWPRLADDVIAAAASPAPSGEFREHRISPG
jgi:CubicO group peptidase (beta-lactamase class C family)